MIDRTIRSSLCVVCIVLECFRRVTEASDAHHRHYRGRDECREYAVEGQSEAGVCTVQLAHVHRCGRAEGVGCGSHRQSLSHWGAYMGETHGAVAGYSAQQSYAHHHCGRERRNAADGLGYLHCNRRGDRFGRERQNHLARRAHQSGYHHYRHNAYYAARKLGYEYRQELLLYGLELLIERHTQCHNCRTQPELNHVAAGVVGVVARAGDAQEYYDGGYCHEYGVHYGPAGAAAHQLAKEIRAECECYEEILVMEICHCLSPLYLRTTLP